MELSILTVITPDTFAEATRILSKKANVKGFAPNTAVYLSYLTISPSNRARTHKNMVVTGGTAENPVRIYVESGMNVIEIVSGHVEIACESNFGNVVYAHENATVAIEADCGRKISVAGDGVVTFKTNDVKHRLRDNTTQGIEVHVLVTA